MIVWGVVICVLLIAASIKAGKGMWLVTLPAILVIAVLAIDFTCYMLRLPRHVVPYQAQIVSGIKWTLQAAAVPLLLIKLYELWSKKRAQAAHRPQDASPSE